MGIIDFVKDAGEKLFKDQEKAAVMEELTELKTAQRLTELVMAMKLPVEGLRVTFGDGTATVFGTAEIQPVKENIVIFLGNMQGVARVDDRMEVKESGPQSRMYTVKRGDTLSKIAKEMYGDAMKYPVIFEANTPMLENPDRIYPGQVLRIPPA
jgi:nucleoid-associated protein YgaU